MQKFSLNKHLSSCGFSSSSKWLFALIFNIKITDDSMFAPLFSSCRKFHVWFFSFFLLQISDCAVDLICSVVKIVFFFHFSNTVKASLICRVLSLGICFVLFISFFIFIQFEGSSYHDGINEELKKINPHMSFTRMYIRTRTKKISRKLSNRLRPLFAAKSIVANCIYFACGRNN